MRLIDGDALAEIFSDRMEKIAERYGVYSSESGILSGAYTLLKAQPTIEPRKKGKWIPMYAGQFTGGAYWFECSDCGRVVPNVRNGGWNFCPNCGADMEE